jgi:hypothetical protein
MERVITVVYVQTFNVSSLDSNKDSFVVVPSTIVYHKIDKEREPWLTIKWTMVLICVNMMHLYILASVEIVVQGVVLVLVYRQGVIILDVDPSANIRAI